MLHNPDDDATLAAYRVADASPDRVVPGSTQDTCAACGAAVWISPATRRSVKAARILCIPCVVDEIAGAPEGETIDLFVTTECQQEALQTVADRHRRN